MDGLDGGSLLCVCGAGSLRVCTHAGVGVCRF